MIAKPVVARQFGAAAKSSARALSMYDRLDRSEWHARKLRDWLLAIVRFALSRDEADRQTILALAEELDGLGSLPGRASFSFFRRATADLERAIADREDPHRTAIVRRLLATIDDHRLKQVVAAAVDPEGASRARPTKTKLSSDPESLPRIEYS